MIDQFADSIEVAAADLDVSDTLLRLGDVHYPHAYDPTQPAVIVADARPPEAATADATQAPDLVEVRTSIGSYYVRPDVPAWVKRDTAVDATTILLISRRAALHTFLCAHGSPIQRRTPVTFDTTAHPVTAQEWHDAALVVIDGYLLGESIAALWERGDLTPRPGTVLLCSNPDDARTDALAHLAHAVTTVVLPYDGARMCSLFKAAHSDPDARLLHPDVFPAAS